MLEKVINFDSNISYYVQLLEILKSKIENSEWKVGDKLPSEAELCAQYGVSRTVVRQALRELELDGNIYRRKGKGTFVTEVKIQEGLVQELLGFHQDMSARGKNVTTRVLNQEIIRANKKISTNLNISVDDPVIWIKRLRYIDGEPLVLVSTYLPLTLCPQVANANLEGSLYSYLKNSCNIELVSGHRIIEAVGATEEEADLLNCEVGDPMIFLRSVSFIENGTPIEFYEAVHKGDRSRFEVDLIRK